jgi:Zn-dependent oligopeptidase
MRYRKTILAPGGSRDSIESLRLFLGRDPNQDAFIRNNNFDGLDKE